MRWSERDLRAGPSPRDTFTSMTYEMGNPDIDARIRELVADASDNPHDDLITELITTALRLHRDNPTRGDLRLINTALKEMRYSNLVFSRHDEPKVTIYGSARLHEDDPNYKVAEDFARRMTEHGWGVITGAGPGIMEAGNRGAGKDQSYGVNIRLPFEASANRYLDPSRTVNFKYFFTRKLAFVKESHAFVICPGGWGTLDEAFELLTLTQTGKSDLHPIVLLEAEGTGYWDPLIHFIEGTQLRAGLITDSDLSLYHHTTDVEGACDHITQFYSNYHSQRYAAGRLILRLRQAPDPEQLVVLSEDFADILVDGTIDMTEPTAGEIADGDALHHQRVSLHFDRRHFGRLRQLIDRLNEMASLPDTTEIPPPLSDEMADRPW
jgi:uncharacterized protein (TIGR00730 family)